LLPAGAVAGWDLHPLESAAFARRTPAPDIGIDLGSILLAANIDRPLIVGWSTEMHELRQRHCPISMPTMQQQDIPGFA
jgi:hypothetical protein